MRKEPDIVKELREAEKLGLLQSKAESVYVTPERIHSSENDLDQISTFIDTIGQWDSEAVYRKIIEQTIVGVVITKNGKVVFCNKKGSEIFGYETPSDLIGKSVSDLVHKDDISWLNKFAEELKNGKASPHLVTFRGIRADGKEIYVEGYAIPVSSHEESTAFLSFHIDVTKHRKDEERVREQKEIYRLITENTSDLIAVTTFSLNPKYTYINPSHEKIMGYTSEDLIGKPAFDLIHPDDKKKLVRLARKYIGSKSKKLFTGKELDLVEKVGYRVIDKSGNWHYLESTINLMEDKILIISKDVSDQRKIQEKYQRLFDVSPDLLAEIDENGNVLVANPAMARSLMVPLEKLIGRNIYDILPRDIADRRIKLAKKTLEENKIQEFEDKKGERYFRNIFAPIYSPDGKNTVLIIARDITERKKYEEKIRESEERFRDLFENANDLIQSVDINGKFIYVNKSWLRTLGYTEQEVKNLTILNILREDQREHCMKIIQKISNGESFDNIETVFITKDGREIYVEGSVNGRFKDGKFIATRAIFRNVTERKKMEEELIEAYSQMMTLLNAAADGIRIVNRDFTVKTLNDTMVKLADVEKEKSIGMKCSEMFGSDACGTENCSMVKILREGKSFCREAVRKRPDGKKIPCLEVITPFRDAEGNIIGIIEDFRDISEIKEIEQKLSENEEKYRTIFEASPEAIILVDPKGILIDANKRVTEWLGYNVDDLIGKNIAELPFLTDESKKIAINHLHHRLQGEIIPPYDLDFVKKNGEFAVGRIHGTRIKCCDSATVADLVLIADVTEQKQFEKKLQESEEKFRIITSAAYDAIIMMDADGNISYWNKAAEKMFGYKSEEVIGKNLHMILAPKDFYIPYKKGFEKFKNTGEGAAVGKTIELPALRKDGTDITIDLSLSSVKIKGKWNAIGIIRDISERKEIEKEIKIRDEAIKSSINGIAITDSMGNIIYVNDSFLKMWRYNKLEEVIGKPIASFWEINENYRKIMGKLIETGGWTGELIAKRKDRSTFPVQLSVNFVKDENSKISNIFASFVDITEQKKAEEKLLREQKRIEMQNIQLKKLDRIKSEFLNITSHELRTPMSAIKGYAQMILKEALGPITDEQKKALNVVLRNINRLDNLIRDILDVSRLESGTMKFLPEHVDIKEMILQVAETMQSSAETKKIQIKTEIQENLPRLFVDPERIKQVIINIINNAIKFSPENSTIIVRVKKDKKDKILFEIQDFGKGIPKNKQKKIFETFYQVDSGMDRKFGGAGLGLAISKGIILSHGGKIWVNSKPGEGSTFKFTLPVKPVINHEERFKEADIFGLETNKKTMQK